MSDDPAGVAAGRIVADMWMKMRTAPQHTQVAEEIIRTAYAPTIERLTQERDNALASVKAYKRFALCESGESGPCVMPETNGHLCLAHALDEIKRLPRVVAVQKKLIALLDDPHPGLITWNTMLAARRQELAELDAAGRGKETTT